MAIMPTGAGRKARFADGVVAAQRREIVREDDAGGPLRQCQQGHGLGGTAVGIVVDALPHIFLRNLQAQLFAGLIEARQTVLSDGGLFAVDKGDAAVAAGPCLPHQSLQAGNVVREDGQVLSMGPKRLVLTLAIRN